MSNVEITYSQMLGDDYWLFATKELRRSLLYLQTRKNESLAQLWLLKKEIMKEEAEAVTSKNQTKSS